MGPLCFSNPPSPPPAPNPKWAKRAFLEDILRKAVRSGQKPHDYETIVVFAAEIYSAIHRGKHD